MPAMSPAHTLVPLRARRRRHGTTSIQYGLIAMIISVVVFGSAIASGLDLASVFNTLCNAM